MSEYSLFSNGSKKGSFSKDDILNFYYCGNIDGNAMVKIKDVWVSLDNTGWLTENHQDQISFNADNVDNVPQAGSTANTADKLVECPHCWFRFSLSKINFISKHLDLMGDPILGPEAQLRFLPTSFNAQGYALDAKGMVCQDMACPNCHQKIPEALIDFPSNTFSIAGAPACGKSYYLAAMTWQLRNVLSKHLDYSFTDTDATFNSVLNNYESILFLNRNSNEYVALPKTELQGNDFSHQIMLNNISVDLPLPFIFTVTPSPANQNYTNPSDGIRNIVLYDNAGEHFEPGRDLVTNLSTQHLIHSKGIMFLYDPIKDSRMVTQCDPADPQVAQITGGTNQLVLLNEMIARIKKYSGIKTSEKCKTPLIIIVPKYDAWRQYFPFDLKETSFLYYDENNFSYSFEIGQVANISYVTRDLLLQTAPEVVATCESFFEQVYFLPVSSLGRIPEYDPTKDMIGIKPIELQPIWVEVPMLLLMWLSGYINAVCGEFADAVPVEQFKFFDSTLVCALPGTHTRLNIPPPYWGKSVYCMELEQYIKFPMPEKAAPVANDDDFWKE